MPAPSSPNWSDLGAFSRVSTSSAIAARIMELAATGKLTVGTPLPPERTLATQLGVSRSTVREAIHELAMKGLIERRQGSGTVLVDTAQSSRLLDAALTATERDAREAADFRNIFEPQTAALAAERATPGDLERMREICDYSPESVSAEESLALDLAFHAAVAAATQNRLIVTLSKTSADWITEFRQISHDTPEARRASLTGHLEILRALAARDADGATAAMREHIASVSNLANTATATNPTATNPVG